MHSSLQFMPDADVRFEIKVPEVGWRTVSVKVDIKEEYDINIMVVKQFLVITRLVRS